ncbi:MAG: hypothetical protein ACI8PG_003549 [Planctomycetota bacterium]|jgi:hypothetical protein
MHQSTGVRIGSSDGAISVPEGGVHEIGVLALFALFFLGALVQIGAMLSRRRQGRLLGGHRLMFFFMASLMLVCLVPLGVFNRLSLAVWVSDLSVVLANLIGWALTYGHESKKEPRAQEEAVRSVRAYTIYYQGKPLGIVTKEGFEKLAALKLLRKQRTVELVENYKELARGQGARVLLLENQDRSQTLIKVEGPEPT